MEVAETFREPGSSAALRWVFEGKICGGRAATVVEDGPKRTLLAWGLGDLPTWIPWEPDSSWEAPRMPENWDSIRLGINS